MTDAGHEYLHPGYKKPYPIETVLRDLAAQEGCDGEPYDAMVFAAAAITTLRAQLAEAQAERDAWRDQCRDPLLGSFAKALEDHRESIPVAIWSHIDALQKQIDYSANGKYGPVYSGPMVDAAFARADRAEAALAAQIEVDAAMFDNDMNLSKQICCNGQMCGCRGATAEEYVTHAIRNQPHDRTALDRHDAKTREKALREAYEVVYKWWFGDGNALPQELILALIEKPE